MTATKSERYTIKGAPNGVDRKTGHGVIRGAILAEVGPFKTPGRGEFDLAGLEAVRDLILANPKGLKAGWTHPGASNDGLGTYLGKWKNPRVEDGKLRADLHFAATATKPTPTSSGTSYAEYLMDLAEEDPQAFESSLRVARVDREYRTDSNGNELRDSKGNLLPPLWRVKKLPACDVVDSGEATHSGFLSETSHRNTNSVSLQVTEALDRIFSSHDRNQTSECLTAFVDRYLSNRFGEETVTTETKIQGVTAELKTVDFSAQIRETIANELKPIQDMVKTLSDAQAATAAANLETERVTRIVSLCKEYGKPDLAEEFVKDKNLTYKDVSVKLLEEFRKENKLTSTDGKQTGEGGEDAELRKEYNASLSTFQALNLSFEDYAKSRKEELAAA